MRNLWTACAMRASAAHQFHNSGTTNWTKVKGLNLILIKLRMPSTSRRVRAISRHFVYRTRQFHTDLELEALHLASNSTKHMSSTNRSLYWMSILPSSDKATLVIFC